jgi:hypothetical protein
MLAQKPEGLSAHPAAGAMGVKVIGTEDLAPGRIKFLCEFDYGPDHGKMLAHLITYEVQGGWKLEGDFDFMIEEVP